MSASTSKLLFLEPLFVEKIWGGRKLASEFGYELPSDKVGECWAIAAHPHGDCRVSTGQYADMTLSQLWDEHRELFGNAEGERFPLLIKLIDAQDDLSIQVHPNDAYAAEHEEGSLGKRECWYVLEADEGAHIVVGQHAKDRQAFEELMRAGNWDALLNKIPVHAGDFFAVEPGTVHALNAGALILETQQSSDITYRLYDYDRTDDTGSKRELHLAQSLEVIDFEAPVPTSGAIVAKEHAGITHLLHNESFDVLRLRVHSEAAVTLEQRWNYLCASVVAGSGNLVCADETVELNKGMHFIVLAGAGTLSFTGEMELICSYVV